MRYKKIAPRVTCPSCDDMIPLTLDYYKNSNGVSQLTGTISGICRNRNCEEKVTLTAPRTR